MVGSTLRSWLLPQGDTQTFLPKCFLTQLKGREPPELRLRGCGEAADPCRSAWVSGPSFANMRKGPRLTEHRYSADACQQKVGHWAGHCPASSRLKQNHTGGFLGFLEVQRLRLCVSIAGGAGSTPSRGTKIPHLVPHGQRQINEKLKKESTD